MIAIDANALTPNHGTLWQNSCDNIKFNVAQLSESLICAESLTHNTVIIQNIYMLILPQFWSLKHMNIKRTRYF